MNGKIKIHLMMLVSFMLCNASSTVLANGTAIATDEKTSLPQERIVSATLRFEGDVIEMLPLRNAVPETSILRGKRIEWLGTAGKDIAKEERLSTVVRSTDMVSEVGPRK